jgi:hypothetical protein
MHGLHLTIDPHACAARAGVMTDIDGLRKACRATVWPGPRVPAALDALAGIAAAVSTDSGRCRPADRGGRA